jgi:type II secretory pathway pseudopilin PulG
MELLLVLGIIAVIGAVAVPVCTTMFTSSRVNAAVDAVRSQLAQTRNRAMEERRPYRFAIKENTGKYRIAPDSSDYWADAPQDSGSSSTNSQPPLEVEGSLPENVKFSFKNNGKDSGDWHTVAIFMGDGTASEDAEVYLAPEGAQQPTTIRVQATTGEVSVAELATMLHDS